MSIYYTGYLRYEKIEKYLSNNNKNNPTLIIRCH